MLHLSSFRGNWITDSLHKLKTLDKVSTRRLSHLSLLSLWVWSLDSYKAMNLSACFGRPAHESQRAERDLMINKCPSKPTRLPTQEWPYCKGPLTVEACRRNSHGLNLSPRHPLSAYLGTWTQCKPAIHSPSPDRLNRVNKGDVCDSFPQESTTQQPIYVLTSHPRAPSETPCQRSGATLGDGSHHN